MNSWTITARFAAVIALFSATLVGFGWFAARTRAHVQVGGPLYRQISTSKDLIADILPPPAYIMEAYLLTFQVANATDAAERELLLTKLEVAEKAFEERIAFWAQTLPESRMKATLVEGAAQPGREFFQIIHAEFLPAIKRGNSEVAHTLANGKLRQKYAAHRGSIDEVVVMADQVAKETEQLATATVDRGMQWEIGFCGGGLFLGIGISLLMLRQLVRHLRMTAGELETGAQQNASAAAQVASSSQLLAGGSSQQAASLEETSASLEELGATASGNAEAAERARALAADARQAAEQSAADLREMSQAMQEIKGASDDVAKIVRTIDEIAFQTNLLALNAAVEAARAGDTGRGFAVVAEEVRALALRSAGASKETASRIEAAIATTGRGVALTDRVAAGMGSITGTTREVDRLVGDVATASREQTASIQQINRAVSAMDKVVQSNAAAAEEGAAAAEELSQQAQTLTKTSETIRVLVDGGRRVTNTRSMDKTASEPGRGRLNEFAPSQERARVRAGALGVLTAA